MKAVKATLADGRQVEYLPTSFAEGGMKRMHFTPDRKWVLGFYKDQSTAADPNRIARLEAILGKFNPTTHADHGAYFSDLFCWPTGIVVRPELGVMMPVYTANFFFADGRWKGKEKKGKWFSSPKLRKLLPPAERGDWKNYLELCLRMAQGVRKMHYTGLAHSDLSCNNVLIDPPGGRCWIIDLDALVVPGIYPPDVLGTPGYIAPEVIATQHLEVDDPQRVLPSNLTDLHALGVLVYEYLLRRHPLRGPKVYSLDPVEDDRQAFGAKALFIEDPRDPSNRPKELGVSYEHLGPRLKDLFDKAFGAGLHGPAARPVAGAWERELARALDLLIRCGNAQCEEKWFVLRAGAPPRCPWCGWSLKTRLPVLDFYLPRKGQYRPEGHSLVAWDQDPKNPRPIYQWHVLVNVTPGEGVDREPQALIQYRDGQWLLMNRKLDSLVSPAGNPVPVGQACLLADGAEILLSKEERGRLVSVRYVP